MRIENSALTYIENFKEITCKWFDEERQIWKGVIENAISSGEIKSSIDSTIFSQLFENCYLGTAFTGVFTHVVDRPGGLSKEAVADAYNRLGDTRYYASDFDGAEKFYDKAYSTYPSAGDYALFQKGVMQGYRRNHKAKIATLTQMCERFPSSVLVSDALLEITESRIQLDDNDGAIATYRRLVADFSGTEQGRKGHLQMAQTMLNAGRRTDAIETYKDDVKDYPTSVEAAEASDALKRLSAEDGTLQQYMDFMAGVDGAPKMDVAEADRLSYETADKALVTQGNPARMEAYLTQ